ncbi:MAG: DUF4405 domain-containing protein [Lachnospiraceae bacterium]|nr:DUF4405 domain-containing protein [Acetatifactor muris]MCM1224118.1 DUF4405 domain-containing protein [Lachnospiraceae bacterium]
MNGKMKCRIAIDMLMTAMLLFLMGRQITGDSAHEWLGAGMFVLWALHHILNWNWHGHILKGKYTPMRVLQTTVNVALFLSMMGLMVSGIILSREVFAFLPISGGVAFARALHVPAAFWGFVLMALHLGLHWNMMLNIANKAIGSVLSKRSLVILRMMAAMVAGYGFYAFIKNQFFSYLFLRISFVFFDYEKPALLFFTEYAAVMGMFVFLAHYCSMGMKRLSKDRKSVIEAEKE